MGLYAFVSEEDRKTKRKVSDEKLNEVLQEALKYDPSLMISEYTIAKREWFKTLYITKYEVWHETPSHDGSAYQARIQLSATGSVATVFTYLFGIINGGEAQKEQGKKKSVYGNSTAFRDWLDSKEIKWKANDQCTILIGELDLFSIGVQWANYKEANQHKGKS